MSVHCPPVSIGYSQTPGMMFPQEGRGITCDDTVLPTAAQIAAYVTAPSAQQDSDSGAYGNGRSKAAQFVIPCREQPRCRLSILGGHATAISGKKVMFSVTLLNETHRGNVKSGKAKRILEFEATFGTNNATAHVNLKVHPDSRAAFVQASWAESFTEVMDESRGGVVLTGVIANGVAGLDFDTENAEALLVSVTCQDSAGVAANGADAVVFDVEWL